MRIDGQTVIQSTNAEYTRLYARFARVLEQRHVDVDLAPFNLVADAFLHARRRRTPPFYE
jgi:hypothetical protein